MTLINKNNSNSNYRNRGAVDYGGTLPPTVCNMAVYDIRHAQ